MTWVPDSDTPYEQSAIWRGEEYRHSRANEAAVQRSIAISLKRIADMMEEDRKPVLEMMPEGQISAEEHRRILRDQLIRDGASLERIASAIEARSAEPMVSARKGESATAESRDAQGERP